MGNSNRPVLNARFPESSGSIIHEDPPVARPGVIFDERRDSVRDILRDNGKVHVSEKPDFAKHDFRDSFSIVSANQTKPTASAVLIASNAILTAAHFRKANPYKSNFWQVTNSIYINKGPRLVCKPGFPLRVKDEDLEVLILEQPIELFPPVKFASTQEINQTKTGLIVGYGDDEDGHSGIKRELGVNIELCSENNNFSLYHCDSKRHLIIRAERDKKGETDGINRRDSGCPLYIKVGKEVKLAGIASMSLNNGEAGLFIRVDTYKKEIDKIIQRFKEN